MVIKKGAWRELDIVVKSSDGDYGDTREWLIINGKQRLCVGPLCECPEDAIIGRDLVSCNDVVNYMKEAYDAAKKGEAFNFVFLVQVVADDEE